MSGVAALLPRETALIGFAGAPWTVAAYMVEGTGSRDFLVAKQFGMGQPKVFQQLLDMLVSSTVEHLSAQIAAGAELVQLFDSWAGALAEPEFRRWVVAPTKAIVTALRARHPTVPIIGFPRGAGALVETYAEGTPVDGIALDTQASAALGRRLQAQGRTIQGALDNLLLRAGGPALDARVDQLLAQWGDGPWIFNLGHGIMPDTPIANIARVVERVTGKPANVMAAE